MCKRYVFTTAAIIALAGVMLAQAPKPNSPSPTATSSTVKLKSYLTQTYDLKPKYKKGEVRYQRLVIVYNTLDPGGHIMNRNEIRGDLERRVESVLPDGKAYERITWKSRASRIGQGATGPYGPYQFHDWAEGFSYQFSAEDPYDKFYSNYEKFPKTMPAYQALGHMVSAHFEFDFLRSSYHGAIEKLRKIDDEVEAPDNHQPFTINLPPMMPNSNIQKNNVRTRFIGLTYAGGEPCAIIAHWQGPGDFWIELAAGPGKLQRIDMTSTFAGNLYVRLSNGSLVHGDFVEWVMAKLPGSTPEKPSYGYTRGDYNIDEISREEYLKGISDSAK